MGELKERFILQSSATSVQGYEQAGTLDGWRDGVARLCVGNHRLMMGVCSSFAAPLLHHLDQQGFGINYRGSSSIGKTTILRAAKSVVGDHAHIRTWRATSSALESIAAMHNDNVLLLDEMGEADPKEIGPTAYMLANGMGKARQTRTIELRPALTWRLIYLSTGEVSLADMLAQAKQRVKAGQAVRVIDLPADSGSGYGVFDCLPEGFSGGAELADTLKENTKLNHGLPFVAYMSKLVEDLPKHVAAVKALRDEWKSEYLPAEADSQVKRVADSFATVAAGGELATDLGITGWTAGDAGLSVGVCFREWYRQRGGLGNQEEADIIRHVKNHFEADGAAKYAYIETRLKDDKTMYRMGFKDSEGDYFVLTQRFDEALCREAGFDKKQVVGVLLKHGILLPGGDGRSTVTKRVYSPEADGAGASRKKTRLYHISSSVLGEGE